MATNAPHHLSGFQTTFVFKNQKKRLNLFLHFSQKERNPENVEHLFDLNICQRWPTFGQKTDTLCCWLVKKSWKKNFDAKWNNWFYDRIIYFPFISCSEILYNCCTKKSNLNLNLPARRMTKNVKLQSPSNSCFHQLFFFWLAF